MTKKQMNGLTVRKLTPKDAILYQKISYDEEIHKYLIFLEARTTKEAEKRIRNNTCSYSQLYGLFNKYNRLVAVYVITSNVQNDGATVDYFVGERYRRSGYAGAGIKLLAKVLASQFDFFLFVIRKENTASIRVQKKLGSKEILPPKHEKFCEFVYSL